MCSRTLPANSQYAWPLLCKLRQGENLQGCLQEPTGIANDLDSQNLPEKPARNWQERANLQRHRPRSALGAALHGCSDAVTILGDRTRQQAKAANSSQTAAESVRNAEGPHVEQRTDNTDFPTDAGRPGSGTACRNPWTTRLTTRNLERLATLTAQLPILDAPTLGNQTSVHTCEFHMSAHLRA